MFNLLSPLNGSTRATRQKLRVIVSNVADLGLEIARLPYEILPLSGLKPGGPFVTDMMKDVDLEEKEEEENEEDEEEDEEDEDEDQDDDDNDEEEDDDDDDDDDDDGDDDDDEEEEEEEEKEKKETPRNTTIILSYPWVRVTYDQMGKSIYQLSKARVSCIS